MLLIRNAKTGLFWSNEDGWVAWEGAEQISGVFQGSLPLDGEIVDSRYIITPVLDGERIGVRLSPTDYDRFGLVSKARRPLDQGRSTDLDTGVTYHLRSAPCGLDCYCDSVAEVVS